MKKRNKWPCCPKCKSKEVTLVELWEGHSIVWIPGSLMGDGLLQPGEPYRVEGNCIACNHAWKIRGVIQINPEWFEECE